MADWLRIVFDKHIREVPLSAGMDKGGGKSPYSANDV